MASPTETAATNASSRATRRNAKRHSRRWPNWVSFALLVSPAVILFAVFILFPLADMFRISTLRWDSVIRPATYVGLQNFELMLRDRNFYDALRNTLIHLAFSVPLVIFPGFMLGFFLAQRLPGYRILLVIFFSPAMISIAAMSMIFLGVYLPDGILNNMLSAMGLGALRQAWLANPSTAFLAIMAIDLWGGIGYHAVIFYAALSNTSREVYEAAILDGANRWTVMWRISLPLVRDFFGVALTLHFLYILLGSAQNILILTQGGPANYTLTLGYYLYDQAFKSQRIGYSQALGVVIFFVGVVGILAIRRFTRERDN